ncbi:helix-turn-helix domain-containing protein [Streptomyces sp. NBC_01136]|uniref:helix-turn-helix domain-containing protein n=2 Tax=unclassified Streptomyces TaxID=2593676 RepID=UPI00324F7CD8|nr:helix-turn-helix domain-containing protein [Streptomyces sp. NBC_01136]
MNEALRRAMAQARMTDRQLAEKCGVDIKTVGRWVTEAGRVPRARQRWAVCEALGEDEAVLWPAAAKKAIKVGPDREVVSVYPYRSGCPASLWRSLITKAERELTFAGYTNYFLWLEQARFGTALRRKAAQGCRVRFLLGDPDSDLTRSREQDEDVALTLSTRIRVTLAELEKIRRQPGIDARFSDGHAYLSVFRFDDDMILTPLLTHSVGHDAPTLHLRRHQNDGMFGRFASHVDELWNRGTPVWEGEVNG